MTNLTPAAKRLQKQRIALLLDHPFFGSLMMHLKPIETKQVPTFSTDGKVLCYNPDFMDKLDDVQLRTVLAHEVMHCALLHPYRRGQRDLRQFNIAADYAINNFLDNLNKDFTKRGQAGPFPVEGLGLVDHQYDDLSAEEIYARLPQQQSGNGGSPQGAQVPGSNLQTSGNGGRPQGPPQPSNSSTSPGEFTDGAADQAEAEEQESMWKVALKQAALAAKGQGKLPASMERLVEEFLNPKVPWAEVLRTFLTSAAKDDYSWARPNRRYSGAGVILPGMHSPKMGPVVVAVDTSGSIGQKEFDEFIAEVRGILFDCRPDKLILVQCDAAVHDWQELEVFDEPAYVKFKGGGGTDFRPVFDRVDKEMGPGSLLGPPAALVYLTDMMGTFPSHEPGYPVLWAATTGTQGPFGITLQIS